MVVKYKVYRGDLTLEEHVLKDIICVKPSKTYVFLTDSKGNEFQLPLYRCLMMRITENE